MLPINSKELSDGMLYLLEIELEGKVLVKIGMTRRGKIEERVCEILTSIWKKYREFPRCYVKRYRKVCGVCSKEAALHSQFGEYRYGTQYKFSGSTEIFDVELDTVVEAYERLLDEG